MQINIIIIDKKSKDKLYSGLIEYYIKIAKPFAKINVIEVFDKEIAKAHGISPQMAQKSYTKALSILSKNKGLRKKHLRRCWPLLLDGQTKFKSSAEFSEIW